MGLGSMRLWEVTGALVLVVSDELTVDRVEDVTRPSAPKIQPASKAKAYRMPASSAKSNDAMSTVT
eukprot:4067270-Amphidinium_carterae.1